MARMTLLRRLAAGGLAALLAVSAAGCRRTAEAPEGAPAELSFTEKADLSAAVLHSGEDGPWRDTLSHLTLTTLANATAEAAEPGADLAGYDLLVADPDLLEGEDWAATRQALMDYVQAGGLLVLDNACSGTSSRRTFWASPAARPWRACPRSGPGRRRRPTWGSSRPC